MNARKGTMNLPSVTAPNLSLEIRSDVCPHCLGNGFVQRSENLITVWSQSCPQCHGFGTATAALAISLLGAELEEYGFHHDFRDRYE